MKRSWFLELVAATAVVVTLITATVAFAPPPTVRADYLPHVDPSMIWIWETESQYGGGPAYTDRHREYTAAFWSYFRRHHPDMTPLTTDFSELPARSETARLMSQGEALSQTDPVSSIDPREIDFDAVLYTRTTKDTRDAFDPATCGRQPPTLTKSSPCETDRVTGPDGAEFRYVTGHTRLAEIGPHRYRLGAERFIVHYRDDGSTVVVRDATFGGPIDTPTLSFDELADLALALPVTDW